jgi:glycosyltransferase involved in cell wall biosynthesis
MKIAVVVPAKNEERLIGKTIWPVPESVDTIYVVDDGSNDKTADMVRHYARFDYRIRLIHNRTSQGVGAAIITGYCHAYKDGHDVFVVVGGDAQMDWLDLDNLLKPIADGKADYTKGNRFIYGRSKDAPGNAWREMPFRRLFGNVALSILTKLASGYYHINDSQMGYTSMHRRVFPRINWRKARKGYGYPAAWLIRFHSRGVRVLDVPVRAIYIRNERQTQIRVRKFVFYMMGILVKGGLERINREYLLGRVTLPKISVPMIFVRVGSVLQHLTRRIGSTRILSRLFGVFGFRQQLGRVRLLPKMRSPIFSVRDKLNLNQDVPVLNMYGTKAKSNPIDFEIGVKANMILKQATHILFDSALQGELPSNSLEKLRFRIEKVGKTVRTHFRKQDMNQSAK